MKASEIRDLSKDERKQKLNDLKEEIFNLRFQHEIGQLENPQVLKNAKRTIARLKTITKETAIQEKTEKE